MAAAPLKIMRRRYAKIADTSTLVIPAPILRSLERLILEARGREVCGFLSGWLNNQQAEAGQAFFLTNISQSPDHFAISPREHQRVLEMVREGQELIALFHSHRKDARPSAMDKENMNFYALIWLIIGETETRRPDEFVSLAFKPSKEEPRQIALRVEDAPGVTGEVDGL